MDAHTDTPWNGRTVDSGQGTAWWAAAWQLFMKAPGMWIVFGLLTFVALALANAIPLLGWLLSALAFPVLMGGWMWGARKVEQGGTLEVNDLFAGFGESLSALMTLGGALAVGNLLVTAVMVVFGFGALAGVFLGGAHSSAGLATGIGLGLVAVLIVVVLFFVLSLLVWFAVPLVMFDRVPPVDALKRSLSACLANVGAFVVFGLVSIVLSVLATLVAMLGWIVLMPVGLLAMYVSYASVFGRGATEAPVASMAA